MNGSVVGWVSYLGTESLGLIGSNLIFEYRFYIGVFIILELRDVLFFWEGKDNLSDYKYIEGNGWFEFVLFGIAGCTVKILFGKENELFELKEEVPFAGANWKEKGAAAVLVFK